MVAPPALPPLRNVCPAAPPRNGAPDAARLARLALSLAALALPVLGSKTADTIHRGGAPGTQQTVVPPPPSGRTTVSQASRSVPVLREAALALRRSELIR